MSDGGLRNGDIVEKLKFACSHVVALQSTSNWKFSETGGTASCFLIALSLKTRSDPSLNKGIISRARRTRLIG